MFVTQNEESLDPKINFLCDPVTPEFYSYTCYFKFFELTCNWPSCYSLRPLFFLFVQVKTQRIWIQGKSWKYYTRVNRKKKSWRRLWRQDFALLLVSFFFEHSIATHLLCTSSLPTPSFIYCNIFSHLFVSSFVIFFCHLSIILCCWLVSLSVKPLVSLRRPQKEFFFQLRSHWSEKETKNLSIITLSFLFLFLFRTGGFSGFPPHVISSLGKKSSCPDVRHPFAITFCPRVLVVQRKICLRFL